MDQVVTAGIVEDHPVVIEGITSWIGADPEQASEFLLAARSSGIGLAGPSGMMIHATR